MFIIMLRKIHCFTVGLHTSSTGNTLNADPSVLRAIYDSFDWLKYRPPVTEGHPKTPNDIKACGWVQGFSLSADGNDLYAYCKLTPYGEKLVDSELYKNVSIGLKSPNDPSNPCKGKWCCDHLAFVLKPAIKGLEEFAEEVSKDSCQYNFALDMRTKKTVTPAEPETQDSTEPTEFGSSCGDKKEKEEYTEVSELIENEDELEEEEEEVPNPLLAELEAARAMIKELESLKEQMAEMTKQKTMSEINSFADKLYSEGRFSEAHIQRADLVQFAEKLTEVESFQFSEGESMLSKFFGLLGSVPPMIATEAQLPAKAEREESLQFSESDLPGGASGFAGDSMDLFKKATDYAKRNQVSFEEGLRVAMRGV